jgi:hypothetical protein
MHIKMRLILHFDYLNNRLQVEFNIVYLKHVDNWFLKLDLYYFNMYIFKTRLSTCLR